MKLHVDYDEFHKQLDQIAPVYPENPTLFDDPKDWEVPTESLCFSHDPSSGLASLQ